MPDSITCSTSNDKISSVENRVTEFKFFGSEISKLPPSVFKSGTKKIQQHIQE